MRVGILIAVFAFFLALAASAEALYEFGCCLPEDANCIAGDSPTPFVNRDAFVAACEPPGSPPPQYVTTTSTCVAKCDWGCSCATGNVAGRDVINSTESLLRMTKHKHDEHTSQASTYQWKDLSDYPTNSKCVDICGGGSGSSTPPPPTFTVSGTARNATGAMRDVEISFHTGGQQVQTVRTDISGRYSVPLTGSRSYMLLAVPPTSSPQCRPISLAPFTLTGNKVQDVTLQCAAGAGCTSARPTITTPVAVKGTDGATFTITYDDRCNNFVMFVPFRCEGAGCNSGWTALPSTTTTTVTDTGLKPQTDYCYYVRAVSSAATPPVESDKRCFKTGDEQCMELPADSPTSWCGNVEGVSTVMSCDARNILITNPCTNKACTITSTGPACVEKMPCMKCNGLLGLFGKLSLSITDGGTEGVHVTCGADANQCYKDRETDKPLLLDAYSACTAVEECSDYRSPYSCAGNPCKTDSGTSASCEWRNLKPELGGGVCISKDPEAIPPCRQCNEIFGSCTKEMCSAISPNCYFDAPTDVEGTLSNGITPKGCIPKQEMACRFYDTEADCIGPNNGEPKQAASFAITYDPEGVRTGVTNIRTNSSDLFRFRACNWIPEKNWCIKDADNYRPDNQDDCWQDVLTSEARSLCLRDVTPPVTELILKPGNPPEYGSSEITSLPVQITDDLTPTARITTYACIVRTGSCYPNLRMGQLFVPDEDAEYTLYYYSIDAHYNSEPVKSQRLKVKKDNIPRLTINITQSER